MTLQKSRDFLADWTNWDKELDGKALVHRKKSYFSVGSFDEIKSTMWKFRDKKQGAVMGVIWGWSPSQVILDSITDTGYGHAMAIIGWKKIDGVDYLIAQNSWGKSAGENGKHYLSKEVVNHFVERFGASVMVDINPNDVKEQLKRKEWALAGFFQKIWIYLRDLCK